MESIGLKPFIQLQEYAENKFIPEVIWSNQDFQQLLNLASYCVFLCNDLHSYNWEKASFDGQLDKIENSVVVIAALNKITIQQAHEQTFDLFVKYEQMFDKKKNDLINRLQDEQSVVSWIVNRVEHMVGGHYQGSIRLRNNRYKSI